MAITQWFTTAEVELNQTFNDWRETTNKIRWNLAEINPAANTIASHTANLFDVTISGNTFVDGSYDNLGAPGSFFLIQNANTTINAELTRVGRTTTDLLEVRARFQVDGTATFYDNVTAPSATVTGTTTSGFFSGDGTSIEHIQWNNIDGKPDFGGTYVTAPVTYNDLTTEIRQSLIPGNSILLFRNNGAVPAGYVEVTGLENRALRVVSVGSGSFVSGGTGGTVDFTSAFVNHSHTPSGTVTMSGLTLNSSAVGSLSVSAGRGNLAVSTRTLSGSVTSTTLYANQIPNHWHYVVANVKVGNDNPGAGLHLADETSAGGDTEYDLGYTNNNPNVARSGGVNGAAYGQQSSPGTHTHSYNVSHNHGLTGNPSVSVSGGSHTHTLSSSSISFSGNQVTTDLRVKYADVRFIQRSSTSTIPNWAS